MHSHAMMTTAVAAVEMQQANAKISNSMSSLSHPLPKPCLDLRSSKADPGLPSPSSSSGLDSETSDYQRSTPSPRDGLDSGTGSLEDWTDPGPGDECFKSSSCVRSTRSSSQEHKILLRDVRVQLEKIDDSDCRKRKHATPPIVPVKKVKVESKNGGQGKITEYLPQSKPLSALRKEKLDKILNLKTEISGCKEEKFFVISNKVEDDKKVFKTVKKEILDAKVPVPLSAERKLRFPVSDPKGIDFMICKWEACGEEFESPGKLLDHIKTSHVSSQLSTGDCRVKCLWEGCKVFGKTSSSKSWLEKHVTNHGGSKPFQCIVDGCKQRFGTQSLLERHVNGHFKTLPTAPSNRTQTQSISEAPPPPKITRKVAGRKLKYRKTVYSARIFDLFNVGVMAQLREKLSQLVEKCNDKYYISEDYVEFRGKVVGRKKNGKGEPQVLITWMPENIIPDEWHPLRHAPSTKRVKIGSLPSAIRLAIFSDLLGSKTPTGASRRKSTPLPRTLALS